MEYSPVIKHPRDTNTTKSFVLTSIDLEHFMTQMDTKNYVRKNIKTFITNQKLEVVQRFLLLMKKSLVPIRLSVVIIDVLSQ